MKIYITFGQTHVHSINGKTFDKNCVAEITCENYEQGREIAMNATGGVFATSYTEKQIQDSLHFFPRGIIKLN